MPCPVYRGSRRESRAPFRGLASTADAASGEFSAPEPSARKRRSSVVSDGGDLGMRGETFGERPSARPRSCLTSQNDWLRTPALSSPAERRTARPPRSREAPRIRTSRAARSTSESAPRDPPAGGGRGRNESVSPGPCPRRCDREPRGRRRPPAQRSRPSREERIPTSSNHGMATGTRGTLGLCRQSRRSATKVGDCNHPRNPERSVHSSGTPKCRRSGGKGSRRATILANSEADLV